MVALFASAAAESQNPLSPRMSLELPTTLPSLGRPGEIRPSSLQMGKGDAFQSPLSHENSSNSIIQTSSHHNKRRRNSDALAVPQSDSEFSSELDLQSIMRLMMAIQEGSGVKNIITKLLSIIIETAGANYGCIMLRGHHDRGLLHVEVIMNGTQISVVNHQPLHRQLDVVPARLCE
jgi:hypothetical protein